MKLKLKKCNHSLCNHARNNTIADESLKAILKEKGLVVTKQRITVLNALMSHALPLTVDEVMNKLGKNTCDLATIYRVLGQFVEADLVNTVYFSKDAIHYEYKNPLHHHHHIICKSCKKVELIEECFLEQLELMLAKKGYKNIEHKLEFFGTCKECLVA